MKAKGPGFEVRQGDGGPPERPSPEDVALFLHTSGTTSRPKGVPLNQARRIRSYDKACCNQLRLKVCSTSTQVNDFEVL